MRLFLGGLTNKPDNTAISVSRSPISSRRPLYSLSRSHLNHKKWMWFLSVLVICFVISFHGSMTWMKGIVQNKMAFVIENTGIHKFSGNCTQHQNGEDTEAFVDPNPQRITSLGMDADTEVVGPAINEEGNPEDITPEKNQPSSDSTHRTVNFSSVKETNRTAMPPPKFVMFRAIGNDLPPRHALGQSYENVKFILEHEPDLVELDRWWIVNRIVDRKEEIRIIALLEEKKQKYIHIPVVTKEYAKCKMRYEVYGQRDMIHSIKFRELDYKMQVAILSNVYHDKNLYIMNNNGARNRMISEGMQLGARWILPFDGNCFLTKMAWEEMKMTMETQGNTTKYFQVPMARLTNNNMLLDPAFRPEAIEEPQIIFRNDAKERFNENMRYGRRPKVELLWRLRVPGPWDKWPRAIGPWEDYKLNYSTDIAGPNSVPTASWVARLFSGQSSLETNGALVDRGLMRAKGVSMLLDRMDVRVALETYGFNSSRLLVYNESILAAEKKLYNSKTDSRLNALIKSLIDYSEEAMEYGPFSVVNKKSFPPSGDKHDYYTPSPYFWPNPDTPNGLPYIRKDGSRVPGTELYTGESDRYDRSRIASFFGNTTILALGWYFTEEDKYAEKAALNIRTWFLDPATKMNPHMRFAQIQWGHRNNVGVNYGIIETKDLYYLLDAVRLIYRAGFLTDIEMTELKEWLRQFSDYIIESEQGQDEYYRNNNHGLFYDMQVSVIAAFINDVSRFLNHTERAKSRICTQFRPDGTLPHEMDRPKQLHYIMFTMQGWITLGRIAKYAGVDLFKFSPTRPKAWEKRKAIHRGLLFATPQFNSTWKHDQEEYEDMERFLPIYYSGADTYSNLITQPAKKGYQRPPHLYTIKPIFYAHDGIQPFWNLGLVHPSDIPKLSRAELKK